jgi:hypothetical protein
VRLIATPRDALACWPSRQWRRAANEAALADFDQVPLTGADGFRIESIYLRGQGRLPLLADMFMSAEAPLMAFVETADHQPFRLLVEEGRVVGLVTLSDLQRLPVYSLLFSLLIAVEALLMDWIRKACAAEPDAWTKHLHPRRRGAVEADWRRAAEANLGIDRLSCASFGDEIAAAHALGLFAADPGRHAQLKELHELRNRVYHAMEFAPTPALALQVPERVRQAKDLAGWLLNEVEKP